jgi:uncharacterized protein (DUF1778 family)
MNNKKKLTPSTEKSVRIRFRNQAQVDAIKQAAKLQKESFNSFVIFASEAVASALTGTKPVDSKAVIAAAASNVAQTKKR